MDSVSVIIPTWNRANTIERAVYSALSQTVPPLEVLVCDDCSTDNTEEIVKSIGDSRVRWLSGDHGGRPAIPRNRGIRDSKGDWLAFLDSDDEWLPQKLEKQLALASETGCLALCSNAFKLLPGKGIVGPYLQIQEEKKVLSLSDLIGINYVICSSVLLHRSLIDHVVGFPERAELIVGEDYAFWLRVATQTDFAFHQECLLFYFDDSKNSIRSNGPDEWTQRRMVFRDFLDWTRAACTGAVDKRFISTARASYLRAVLETYTGPIKVKIINNVRKWGL